MSKILAIAGSYRENSYNKRVLNVAVDGARNAGADVAVIDLRDFPLPIYDADMQDGGAFNEDALRLQDVMAEHDSLLPYLDMPLQHADRDVLRSMNRPSNPVTSRVHAP